MTDQRPDPICARADFGPDFHWGVATSAYQIEGAVAEDGRAPSIWDEFERPRRRFFRSVSPIRHGDSARVACDHYHRFADDVRLIADLHVNAYRFSIAWPRVLPAGDGAPNPAGLAFYDRLIDALAERGITPFATLYHWDLPQALARRGGWTNREVVDWFGRYADVCVRAFGDRVKHWVVLNEALTFTAQGYLLGRQAPGRAFLRNFLPAVHHSQLAQAEACRALRSHDPAARIGTAVALTRAYPLTERDRDVRAAQRLTAFQRIYLDPVLGRGYPEQELPFLRKIERYLRPGDVERCAFPLDFLGVNHYFRMIVRHCRWVPLLQLRGVPPDPAHSVRTSMGWEVHAPALAELLADLARDPRVPELLVTENGAAFVDEPDAEGRVRDVERTTYLQQYVSQVLRARNAGVRVNGYFVWSALDNFEWNGGYEHRFGLYYVDYATQARTLKDSGRWYREFLAGGGTA